VTDLTPAQARALRTLADGNGEGCIVKHGAILAAGEMLPFLPVTFLRLITMGLVEGAGRNRIKLTAAGRKAAES
jgi:hypothetical protein